MKQSSATHNGFYVSAGRHLTASPNKIAVALLILLALGATQTQSAHAADRLWSSAAGSAWLTAGNWTGGVPTAVDVAQFGANPTAATGVGINFNGTTNAGVQTLGNKIQEVGAVEITAARAAAMIIGNSSTTVGANGTFRLKGATVNGVADVVIRNNSSQLLTIQNTQGTGNQLMSVALGDATNNVINIDGTGGVTISSVIKDDAGNKLTLGGSGTGALTLTSVNTYTGSTTINSGTLSIDADATLGNGAGTLNLNGGTLNTTANRGSLTDPIPNAISVTAPSSITTTATGTTPALNLTTTSITGDGSKLTFKNNSVTVGGVFSPRFSGAFTTSVPIEIAHGANGTTELNSTNTTGTTERFDGIISGTGKYVRNATSQFVGGATEFTADNTYGGGTSVARGTLYVNNTPSPTSSGTGTGAVTVGGGTLPSGILAGTGRVSGAVTVDAGGTVSPGSVALPLQSLEVGALSFLAGSTLSIDIDTSLALAVGADLLDGSGGLTIAASSAILSLNETGATARTGGEKYTLISYNGSWNGNTFDTYGDDSSFVLGSNTYVINYNDSTGGTNFGGGSFGNFVTLTVTAIPEASSILLGGLVCIVVGSAVGGKKWLKRPAAAVA